VRTAGCARCSDGGGTGSEGVTVTVTDTMDATRAVDMTYPNHRDDPTAQRRVTRGVRRWQQRRRLLHAGRMPGASLPLALGVLAILGRGAKFAVPGR